jgi:hypothetical protein
MESGGKISGNLLDIEQAINVMKQTGVAASQSAKETATISEQMHQKIDEATTALTTYFDRMAEALRTEIQKTKNQLGTAAWEGKTKENADAAEEALNHHVDRVLHAALGEVGEFKTSMLGRAMGFVSGVQTQFTSIMGQIDASYGELAKASKTFADNLRAADESFKFGGSAQ